jgi:EmrB/QacA subfamily drug resistance transporter
MPAKGHIPDEIYQKRWWILTVLCLSLLVVMIGNTSLNVALPSLSKALGATNSQLQWLVDSYSLVFAGFLFTAGALGDRFGRKGILQAGLVLFGIATTYAATAAETATSLIAARAVMGLAGAFIMPATLSILTNVFPPNERARAVGLWAGISGGGIALGPIISGLVLEHYSWHAVFTINIPFIIITILAGAILIPQTSDPEHTNFDPLGAILSIVGLSSIVYALIEAPNAGWLSTSTLSIGIAGLVVLALFVAWELKAKHPMLDIRLFKIPAFGISSLALTLVFFALMGIFFNMSQLLQLVYGYSPLASAVRMLPVAFTIMIASPLATRFVERFGKRRTVSSGLLIVAAGMFLLSRIGVDSTYLALAAGMCVVAFGMGTAMSPTTDLLMSAVPRNRAGMGSAMNDTTRELGGSLGVAILGSLLASQYSSSIASAVSNFPENVKNIAEQSLAGALAVGQNLGGTVGANFMLAAKEAWISGYQHSLLIGAIVIAVAAMVAFFRLPDRSADHIVEEGHLSEG